MSLPPREPRRRLAVLTCMDARLDPARVLELEPGDAHVLRNGGAMVTDDVVRSLGLSRQLGVEEVVVVGHTDCAAVPDGIAEHVRETVRTVGELGFVASGYVYDLEAASLRAVSD